MIKGFLKKLLDDNEKEIRKYSKTVEIINRLEPQMTALPEAAFPAKTQEFKQRLENGESLNDILPEAFALVREAARRTLGMRHFDVQLIGGMVLHDGRIADEDREGKTLVATRRPTSMPWRARGAYRDRQRLPGQS